MFVTYLTTYAGDKMPPLYIGSTTAARLATGYHGSVRSRKYRTIWETELKSAPQLFDTFVMSEHKTADEALKAEDDLQHLFDAVKSSTFVNMAYARRGFVNPGSFSSEVRQVMSIKAKARGMKKAQGAGTKARTGMKDSQETKAKRNASVKIAHQKRLATMTAEQRKIYGAHLKGKPWSEARRLAESNRKALKAVRNDPQEN